MCIFSIVDEFTDDSLSAHESELDRMRGFYADNVEVFKLVEKRETMWKQKLEMEVSPLQCVYSYHSNSCFGVYIHFGFAYLASF